MTLSFACVGDKTDHGGVIITGTSMSNVHGRAIARVGDKVSCPKCGGVYPIVSSKVSFVSFDGASAAYGGDKTACGATILAQQSVATALQDSGPTGETDTSSPDKSYKGRFQLLDDETRQPVPSRPYTVTSSDGQTISGTTDDQGMTSWVETSEPASLNIKHHGDE